MFDAWDSFWSFVNKLFSAADHGAGTLLVSTQWAESEMLATAELAALERTHKYAARKLELEARLGITA